MNLLPPLIIITILRPHNSSRYVTRDNFNQINYYNSIESDSRLN